MAYLGLARRYGLLDAVEQPVSVKGGTEADCANKGSVRYLPAKSIGKWGYSMSYFTASVQYNDFRGTVAADRSDTESMRDYLVDAGLATEEEIVIGYRICFSGNHGHEYEPGVLVYLQKGAFDDPEKVVRAVDIQMTGPKFFSFFKRFDLVMTRDMLDLSGVTVDGPHYGD